MIFLFRISLIFAILLLPYSILGDSHKNQNNCPEDNIATLYDLIYGNYLPFEPPLDEEGNISISQEDLFVMKSKQVGLIKMEPSRCATLLWAS